MVLLCGCGDGASFTGASKHPGSAEALPAKAPVPAATPAESATVADQATVKSAKIPAKPPAPAPAPVTPAPVPSPTPAPATPPSAVTAGSFTAWAEPPNPKPGEDYQILIKIALPPATTAYGESDLSGTLNGTDNYVQDLATSFRHGVPPADPFSLETLTPVFLYAGASAHLSIWVPGAASKVEDTINIHSTLLNETQALKIVFQ